MAAREVLVFLFCVPLSLGVTTENAVVQLKNYAYWPNATIPFYINPEHFDPEQILTITKTLSYFKMRTCLKFYPAMLEPSANEHVLVFENRLGTKKCLVNIAAHPRDEPHRITLGYSCLKSPQIEMIIMRALGFPFEHNRLSRDLYIDVLFENIEPGAIELFTKDVRLPPELRAFPYDVNSAMHFGDRDFSKNGHRTIIFKKPNKVQNRVGLSPNDIRKIDTVYRDECQKRDREEKIQICQSYPGVARRKRDLSLRVNPDITPPPKTTAKADKNENKDKNQTIGQCNEIIDKIHEVIAEAIEGAKSKHCSKSIRTVLDEETSSDKLGIKDITQHVKDVVDSTLGNLTIFLSKSGSVELYQRSRCYGNNRCPQTYRSTKSGAVKYSTQHRPTYHQSTKHDGVPHIYRSGNDSLNEKEDNVKEMSSKVEDDKIEELKVVEERPKRETEDESTVKEDSAKKNENGDSDKANLRLATTVISHGNVKYAERRTQRDRLYSEENTNKKQRIRQRKERNRDYVDQDKENEGEERHYREKNRNKYDRQNNEQRYDKRIYSSEDNVKRETSEERTKYNNHNKMRYVTQGRERESGQEGDIKREEKKKYSEENNGEDKRIRYEKRHEERKGDRKRDKNRENVETEVERLSYNGRALPRTVQLSKASEEFYNDRKWSEGIVRFIIKEDDRYDIQDMRRRIDEVNAILKRRTCVRLQEITEADAEQFEDYLVIDTSPDYVTGRVGGRQIFGSSELFRGGQHRQHAAMMVMAILGFYFEVARHDRDKFIRVHNRHVRPDKLHHFEKIRPEATLDLPYDYKSATHPAWQFWRVFGKTGISTVATYKDQDSDGSIMQSLGQNDQLLSDSDIIKINSVYGVNCLKRSGRVRKRE